MVQKRCRKKRTKGVYLYFMKDKIHLVYTSKYVSVYALDEIDNLVSDYFTIVYYKKSPVRNKMDFRPNVKPDISRYGYRSIRTEFRRFEKGKKTLYGKVLNIPVISYLLLHPNELIKISADVYMYTFINKLKNKILEDVVW